MGGQGSGRRWGHGRDTTDSRYSIDIRYLSKMKMLTPGYSSILRWFLKGRETASISIIAESENLIYFDYSRNNKPINYPINIDRTACNYGNSRPWFLCPTCNKRVALLYLSDGMFDCRHCCNLAYETQNESKWIRSSWGNKANSIRRKLGWTPGIINDSELFNKPKGMHWKTFERLITEYRYCRHRALIGIYDVMKNGFKPVTK